MRMANGVAAHVVETGAGERVVLVHSGAGEARDWRRFTAELPGLRCAAVDLYGCGGTPAWPGPAALVIDDQAELVAEVARSVGAPVHLVGHSYGAAVALRVVVTQPGLARTAAVIEPQCYPLLRERRDPLFDVSLSLWNGVRAAFEGGEPERGWRRFVDYYSGDGFWNRLRPEVRAGFLATSPIERWAALFANPTTLDDLSRVQVPTLVLCGESTTAPERRMCEIVFTAIPRASLGTIAAAGHMSPITHAKDVAARIATHISTHREPADPR